MADWFYKPGTAIAGSLARLLFRARVEGVEHMPRAGAFIVVTNHCSNLDPPILGWATGHQIDRVVHFMAKAEMRRWPIIGWMASQTGVYFVRRGEADRAAQRFSLQALAAGRPIAMFVEGTRSRDGRLKAGRPGAALLAIRSGAPVVPVGIAGTQRIFPGMSHVPHPTRVTVRIGEPLRLPHQSDGRIARAALADGTERIMRAIEAVLPPEQRRLGTAADTPGTPL
jgi:1-acyl-sn-glycerol-3-phosphate acyltransferase